MFEQNEEAIALLAAKYALDTGVVRSVLYDYWKATDFGARTLFQPEGEPDLELWPSPDTVAATMTRLAQQHGLTVQTVASLVFDFRLFTHSSAVR